MNVIYNWMKVNPTMNDAGKQMLFLETKKWMSKFKIYCYIHSTTEE
jgi:hypothetical protein